MKRVRGLWVSERTYRKLRSDVETTGAAYILKDWFGFGKRIKPEGIVLLAMVTDPRKVTEAQEQGMLVQEVH